MIEKSVGEIYTKGGKYKTKQQKVAANFWWLRGGSPGLVETHVPKVMGSYPSIVY